MAALLPHLTLTHAWGFGPPMAFNYPSWMISGIFGCYLVLPLLGWAHRSSRWAMLATFIAVTAGSAWSASLLGSDITTVQREGLGVLRTLPSFVFGLMAGQLRITRASQGGSLLLLVGILALAFGAPDPLEGVMRLALLYMLVYAVLLVDKSRLRTPLRSPLLQAGAKFSFGVYLWHGLVATCLFRLAVPRLLGNDLYRIGDNHPLIAYALIASGVGAAFLLAAISLRTIERHGTEMFIWMWSGPRQTTLPKTPTST
jgi:peptidoglycan/LPS O-acetylase OafA/YrhL